MTVARKPGHRGEHEATVKTIARGMPGDPGVTVVTNARVYYTTRAAAGASGARHSLRPLMFSGRDVPGKTRAQRAARSRSCVKNEMSCPDLPAFAKASADQHWTARRSLLTAEVRLPTEAVGVAGIRASIRLRKSVFRRGWIAGSSSPAMTSKSGRGCLKIESLEG